MNTIASFLVNHDTLVPGLYISRVDGDITTYDLRFCRPNHPPFVESAAMHTIEHLFATIVRNSEYGDSVIYFGPMGCRTGFYFLTRSLHHREVIELVVSTVKAIAEWQGSIPGASAAECGNWLEHDLDGAKRWAAEYYDQVRVWTLDMLEYPA